jgi:hypothetical protein
VAKSAGEAEDDTWKMDYLVQSRRREGGGQWLQNTAIAGAKRQALQLRLSALTWRGVYGRTEHRFGGGSDVE